MRLRSPSLGVDRTCLTSASLCSCRAAGKVVINSLLSTERYIHTFSRPVRTLALQPNFAKSSSKSFVCGGLSGSLSLMEKGWHLGGLGGLVGGGGQGKHTEKVLSEGEGPIWNVKWERGGLVAWANDLVSPSPCSVCDAVLCWPRALNPALVPDPPLQGVKLYDTQSQRLLSFIDRPADAPRADLFKPSLTFISPPPHVSPLHEPTQLIVAWADTIKLVRIRSRTSTATSRPSSLHGAVLPPGGGSTQTAGASHTTLHVEITAILQLDAPMAGLVPYKDAFLVFAYLAPEEKDTTGGFYDEDKDDDDDEESEPQRPELRIVSRKGEELSSDALGLDGWLKWRCSDYALIPLPLAHPPAFVVLSPKEVVVARERDDKDRVEWLVERRRYEEALDLVERLGKEGRGEDEMTVRGIGEKFLDSLVRGGASAASVPSSHVPARTDAHLSRRPAGDRRVREGRQPAVQGARPGQARMGGLDLPLCAEAAAAGHHPIRADREAAARRHGVRAHPGVPAAVGPAGSSRTSLLSRPTYELTLLPPARRSDRPCSRPSGRGRRSCTGSRASSTRSRASCRRSPATRP